jgi:hypothetical protein
MWKTQGGSHVHHFFSTGSPFLFHRSGVDIISCRDADYAANHYASGGLLAAFLHDRSREILDQ